MFAVTLICNVPVSTLLSGLETEGCIDVSGIEKDLKSRLVYCMRLLLKYVQSDFFNEKTGRHDLFSRYFAGKMITGKKYGIYNDSV